jgi:hypothetical protein
MSDSWPTQIEESEATYESTYGNEATVHQVVWPAGIIQVAEPEPPEPPCGY